jgi:hypothetical protein
MFNIEELIKKWQELGFLEQMPENLKPNVALKYELASIFLMDNDGYLDNTMLLNMSFPVIYRIYRQGKTIPDVESFIRQLSMFIGTNRETMQDLTFSNVHVESEMCGLFVEQWESGKTIEPIKYINRHKFFKKEKPNNEEVREPVSEPTDDTVINWWDRLKHFFRNLIKK